jgi:hypothetical protein
MGPDIQERQLLIEALDVLQETVKLTARILPLPKAQPRFQADALVEMQLGGRTELFIAQIKPIDRRTAVGLVKAQLQALIDTTYPGYHPLLVTKFVTTKMAEECRKLDLPFIDTAGNFYLHTDHFIADIRGKARPDNPFKNEYRANNPAGLKITFALLCKPELAGAQYREIARYAQVALGTIGPVLDDLTQRDYIRKNKATRTLARKKELINEWVTYYPANLRPTLHARRYQADRALLTQADLGHFKAHWGGEYGAEQLTHYLKAERFTIYVPDTPPAELMTKTRMRLAVDGNTEILRAFWNPELAPRPTPVAPPLLVYADLMATAEPRNLEAAKEVYDRFLETPVDQN